MGPPCGLGSALRQGHCWRHGSPAALILATATASISYSGVAEAQLRCRAVDGAALACGAERVRIMGLDALKTHGRCPSETSLARAAKARMADLVAGGVSLQPHGRGYRRLTPAGRDAAQAGEKRCGGADPRRAGPALLAGCAAGIGAAEACGHW